MCNHYFIRLMYVSLPEGTPYNVKHEVICYKLCMHNKKNAQNKKIIPANISSIISQYIFCQYHINSCLYQNFRANSLGHYEFFVAFKCIHDCTASTKQKATPPAYITDLENSRKPREKIPHALSFFLSEQPLYILVSIYTRHGWEIDRICVHLLLLCFPFSRCAPPHSK